MKNKQPRVYFGAGGFAGISEIRKSGVGEVRVGMAKQPKVYMGGAGVSPKVVLGSVGIKSGTMVCVNSVKPFEAKPGVQKPIVQKPAEEKPVAGTGLTEQEKKAVEFFEKVEAERETAVKVEGAKPTEAEKEEAVKVEEAKAEEKPSEAAAVTSPELPLGDAAGSAGVPTGGKRKRRRRKNRKTAGPELGAALSEAFQ